MPPTSEQFPQRTNTIESNEARIQELDALIQQQRDREQTITDGFSEDILDLQKTIENTKRTIGVMKFRHLTSMVEDEEKDLQSLQDQYDALPEIKELEQIKQVIAGHNTERWVLQKENQEARFEESFQMYKEQIGGLVAQYNSLENNAYERLEALEKEHIDPLKQYGMTEKAALDTLKRQPRYDIENTQYFIYSLERIKENLVTLEESIEKKELPRSYILNIVKRDFEQLPTLR